tara:strand:- start:338 stop:535 length:198 start_codon:yes stop_codon:yes gene_type:complete
MKKNVIIICIDGGRLNEAQNSSIMKQFSPNSMFFIVNYTCSSELKRVPGWKLDEIFSVVKIDLKK